MHCFHDCADAYLTDLELQRQAHKGDTSEACNEYHEQIQSLLDSDYLWLQGLEKWLTMTMDYAAKDINPVMEQFKDAFTPLKGVQAGMGTLVRTTQSLCNYESKLWHKYPELYQTDNIV